MTPPPENAGSGLLSEDVGGLLPPPVHLEIIDISSTSGALGANAQ